MSYTYVESTGYFDNWPKEAFDTLLYILENIADVDESNDMKNHDLVKEYPWLLPTFEYINKYDDITSLGYSTEYRKDQRIVWEDGTGCSGDEGMLKIIRDVSRYYKLPSRKYATLKTKIYDSGDPDQITYHIYSDDYIVSAVEDSALEMATNTLVAIMRHTHMDYNDVDCQNIIKENLDFLINNCDGNRALITDKLAPAVRTWATYKYAPNELVNHVCDIIENIMQYEQQA